MTGQVSDRAGAIGGIGFTLSALLAGAVVPQAPAFDAGTAEIRRYLTTRHARMSFSVLLLCASALFFILFVAMVHRRIRRAEGSDGFLAGSFLVSGTVVAAMGLLGGLLQAALVQRVAPIADESTLRAFYGVTQIVFYDGASLAVAVALGVAAVATLRYGIFGRWTAGVAITAAVLGLATGAVDVTSTKSSLSGVSLLGFVLANVWFVAVALHVLRARTTDLPTPDPTAAAVA